MQSDDRTDTPKSHSNGKIDLATGMEGNMARSLTDEEIALAAGYVLGDLEGDEQTSAEQLLDTNPNFVHEVDAFRVSLQLLPHALPKTLPPQNLRDKVLKAHAAEVAPISASTGTLLQWPKILAAAAVLAALFLGLDNFRLRSQLSLARNEEAQRVAALMQNPRSRLVALQGEGDVPAAGTLLFTAGNWQEVIVSLGDLPPLPPDQVYRMWLSLENGEFIFCGEFRPGEEGSTFIRLLPQEQPPEGVKTTGIFVTADPVDSPLSPDGPQVVQGTI